MKATLTFDLPSDEEGLSIALEAGDVKSALYEIERELRSIRKYEEHSDEVTAMVDRIRALFYDHLGEYL